MPYIKTRDGTDIFVKDWGQGRPVILMHGWPLNADSWDAQAMALAEAGFRAIAYDRRGFGETTYRPEPHREALDALAVLDAVGSRSAIVVGASNGGRRAVDLALALALTSARADLALSAAGGDADRWLDLAQAFAGPPGAGRPPLT